MNTDFESRLTLHVPAVSVEGIFILRVQLIEDVCALLCTHVAPFINKRSSICSNFQSC